MTANDQITTDIEDGVGRTVWDDPDQLDEYAFDIGDAFVRWAPWGDERADDDVWKVTNVVWKFKTTWITDRDDPTTREDHRVYVLLSRERFDELHVPESDLKRGSWKHEDDLDEDLLEGDDD